VPVDALPDGGNEILAERRALALSKLGGVSNNVIAELGLPAAKPWPSYGSGRLRMVARERGVLLMTDGLSEPFDPELHRSMPPFPIDYEIGLEVAKSDRATASEESLARSWHTSLLFAFAERVIATFVEIDVRGMLEKFRVITFPITPPTAEAEALANDDGLVGLLLGLPLVGSDIDLHWYLNDYWSGLDVPHSDAALGFFPVKPLLPDEYAWAVKEGNDGGVKLALKFMERGDAHLVWQDRPSVLRQPKLSADALLVK
jgi:hypothetical protein